MAERKRRAPKAASPLPHPGRLIGKRTGQFLERFDRTWETTCLSNGVRVIHVPTPADTRFYLGAMFHAGSRLETERCSGVSHFLEHMMFRGSQSYPSFAALAEAFEWLGGEWNAATGQEHTEYWYSGIRAGADEAIRLFAEFLAEPCLQDIDTERQIIVRELQGEINEFGLSTDLSFHVANLFWPDSSLALPIIGTVDSLERITLADLRGYRDRYYVPRNMVVCAVGGGPTKSVFSWLERSFAGYQSAFADVPGPAVSTPKAAAGPMAQVVNNTDSQYHVQLSFLCGGENAPETPAYDVISRVLADGFCSRLSKRLRDELGLVYDVSADVTQLSDVGTFDIEASIATGNLVAFLTELLRILKQLSLEGPSQDELERCLRRSTVDLELLPSDPESLGFRLSWDLVSGRDASLARERERLQSLSREDVAKVCRRLFTPSRAAFVALGPTKSGLEAKLADVLARELGSK